MSDAGTELTLRLRGIRHEAEGVISLELTAPDGDELPAWSPGAHLEIELPSGLVRHYSLCGDHRDRGRFQVAVLRGADGGGSAEIHDTFRVGRQVLVRGPRNNFQLVEADDYVFIAGGIGVTPILAMVRALGPEGRWRLHYGGRTPGTMAFRDVLAAWSDNVEMVPESTGGLLDLDGIFARVKPGTAVYCCGPAGLIDAVQRRAEEAGIADRLHIERFASSEAALAEIESAKSGAGFDVELARTGGSVRVEAGSTVLESLRAVLPDLPSSCEEGICGTCETRVLGGVPEHHDQILTDSERADGDSMFICVSRSTTPKLVLDL
ncbi:PDR/VanB family oxidoreductase [Actinomadura sp. LOL_016]|uniref:PDR/VanB family oxidoreductase n=1 Tax=unclassified Actinomadura TaxID=2626254 RepID=UPI003A7FC30D